MKNMIVLAKLGASHGLHGWLKLHSFTDPPENIAQYSNLQIKKKTGWEPLAIAEIKVYPDHLLIKLSDCNQPETARLMTNCLIGIHQNDLPKLETGNYYWSDLTGLKVRNLENVDFGVVDELFATGSNDVMVIKDRHTKKERLLPYTEDVVKKIDLAEGYMLVDWDAEF